MIPQVGSTCSFVFTSKFLTLNGIYRVRAETTFKDALAANIDFIENLYEPAGLSRTDFNSDYDKYLNDKIVVLESVVNGDVVYYVPESIFGQVPDPTISEYYPLLLLVDLGVQKNTQSILPLLDMIQDKIKTTLGIVDAVQVVTSETNKVYLTDQQYAAIEDQRKQRAETQTPLPVLYQQALDQIAMLAARCAGYEDIIRRSPTA